MRFETGRLVMRRTLSPDGRIGGGQSARVVADDEHGLRLWLAAGSRTVRRVDLDGASVRHLPWAEELHTPTTLATSTWGPFSTLMLLPPGAAYSVWWSWDVEGRFVGWYVNFETPAVRGPAGVDVHDETLDLLVAPDRTVTLKDVDELAVQTGDPHFWDAEGARRIRAEARRVGELAAAGSFPFDGTWCDPGELLRWEPTELPWWWETGAAVAPVDAPGPVCGLCAR